MALSKEESETIKGISKRAAKDLHAALTELQERYPMIGFNGDMALMTKDGACYLSYGVNSSYNRGLGGVPQIHEPAHAYEGSYRNILVALKNYVPQDNKMLTTEEVKNIQSISNKASAALHDALVKVQADYPMIGFHGQVAIMTKDGQLHLTVSQQSLNVRDGVGPTVRATNVNVHDYDASYRPILNALKDYVP